MAEIGDVRRFKSKKSLVAYAGIDAPPYQSGTLNIHSRHISKRGSPADEPVCQFMDKKRSEGRWSPVETVQRWPNRQVRQPYKVCMMASANKLLRIYYASVKSYLDPLEA